ncbi:hypothetical protein MMC29_004036 [Sticta canariensis]|nr:hypothetical protein [Sticta canariensis]
MEGALNAREDDVPSLVRSIVAHLLSKVPSPEALRKIEIESPEICGQDGEVWQQLIKRDVPGWQTMPHRPEDPIADDDWYELYWSLRSEAQKRIERDEEAVGAAMQRIQDESEKHRLKHVHPSEVPPLPKMGKMKLIKTPKKKKPSSSLVPTKPDKLTFAVGSKMKVQTGAAFFKKARCEAKEHQAYFGLDSKLSRPSHELAMESTPVIEAPPSWVLERGNPADKELDTPHESSVPKISRAEPDRSAAHQTRATDDERSFRALFNPRKEATASSAPRMPPPALAPKRKRDESEEASAGNQSRLRDIADAVAKPVEADRRPLAPRMRQRAPASIFMPVKRRRVV